MSKQELGVKRDCPECGARFYDLNKDPAECPKCSHVFTPEALLKPRKPRPDDAPADGEETKDEKPENETTLEAADQENAEATSNRKAGLDDEDNAEDELEKLGDIVDLDDDEDDDTLLDDDDDDNDVAGIVTSGDDDDDV